MPEYNVTWTIDLSASTPKEAAELAQAWLSEPDTSATIYTVTELDAGEDSEPRIIDLREPEPVPNKGLYLNRVVKIGHSSLQYLAEYDTPQQCAVFKHDFVIKNDIAPEDRHDLPIVEQAALLKDLRSLTLAEFKR